MANKDVTVAITGFGGLNYPEPGRSIAEAIVASANGNIRVIGLIKSLKETSAWTSSAIDKIIKIPTKWGDSARVLEDLRTIVKENAINVIIPGTNHDAYLLSKLSDALLRLGVKVHLPSVASFELLQPESLLKLDIGDQIKIPKSIRVQSKNNFDDLVRMINFPLMVRSDQMPLKVIYDASAIDVHFESLKTRDSDLYVQEFVAGEAYEISGLFDRNGALITSAMIRGIAMRRDGTVGAGAIVDDPYLEECFIQLGRALNWEGILTASLRLEPNKKIYRIVDLRAHLPSWCMATYWANRNLPEVYLNYILYQSVEKTKKLHNTSLYIASIEERAYPIDMMNQLRLEHSVCQDEIQHTDASKNRVDIDHPINIAVTGLSSLDIVNPGLGVANALRKSEVVNDLIGLAYDHFDSGIYDKSLFDKAFKLHYDVSQKELLKNIVELHEVHSFDVLIPCLDGELDKLISIKDELHEHGIATLLPSKQSLEDRSKKGLCKLDSDWDAFSIPSCSIAASKKEAKSLFGKLGMPLVIKGPTSGCMTVASKHEMEMYYKYFESMGEKEVIVQRKVEGDHYAVSVVCNESHEVVSSVSIKKFARCARGSTWGAVNVTLPELEQAFARFLKSIQWVGPAEGEFILDRFSHHYYLFEVNPRFTGWINFTAELGENQPQIAAELAISRDIKKANRIAEKMFFIRSVEEIKITSRDLAMFTTQGKCVHA